MGSCVSDFVHLGWGIPASERQLWPWRPVWISIRGGCRCRRFSSPRGLLQLDLHLAPADGASSFRAPSCPSLSAAPPVSWLFIGCSTLRIRGISVRTEWRHRINLNEQEYSVLGRAGTGVREERGHLHPILGEMKLLLKIPAGPWARIAAISWPPEAEPSSILRFPSPIRHRFPSGMVLSEPFLPFAAHRRP